MTDFGQKWSKSGEMSKEKPAISKKHNERQIKCLVVDDPWAGPTLPLKFQVLTLKLPLVHLAPF